MIVTGGYHMNGQPNDATNYNALATEGRSIYMLDAKTGEVIAEKRYDVSATDGSQYMQATPPGGWWS